MHGMHEDEEFLVDQKPLPIPVREIGQVGPLLCWEQVGILFYYFDELINAPLYHRSSGSEDLRLRCQSPFPLISFEESNLRLAAHLSAPILSFHSSTPGPLISTTSRLGRYHISVKKT